MDGLAIALSSVFSVLTLILTGITIYNTKKLNDTNTKLAELDLLARTQKANVAIFFRSDNMLLYDNMISEKAATAIPQTHLYRRLIVRNVGQCEAKNIEVSLRSNDGKELNDETGFCFWTEIWPIQVLAPGLEISYPFDVSPDVSSSEDIISQGIIGYWSWENPDGCTESRESNLDFFGKG